MSRKPSLNPPDYLRFAIAPDLKTRIGLMLYSELEQRIPMGAWQKFMEARLREWLDWKKQPLEQFGFPPGYFITGPGDMVESVVNKLKGIS